MIFLVIFVIRWFVQFDDKFNGDCLLKESLTKRIERQSVIWRSSKGINRGRWLWQWLNVWIAKRNRNFVYAQIVCSRRRAKRTKQQWPRRGNRRFEISELVAKGKLLGDCRTVTRIRWCKFRVSRFSEVTAIGWQQFNGSFQAISFLRKCSRFELICRRIKLKFSSKIFRVNEILLMNRKAN